MITRRVKVQLLVFALITVLVVWYGATRFLGVGEIVRPPYTVEMQVADPGGLYPRADVELIGSRVGRVEELKAGPGSATTVVMLIDHDVEIPVDVRGVVAAKSAIGEGFVTLKPLSTDGPNLEDGDVIPLADTVSPTSLDGMLRKLDALAASIPLDDLDVVLRESEKALRGIAPSVRTLIDSTDTLSSDALANIQDTTALLRDARTVLATQSELGPQTAEWTRELALLTTSIRKLDPTLISLYTTGLRASTGVTNLLADNQELLPVLLDNLIAVTTIAEKRVPQLRKTLVVFPWILENQVNTTRACDDYDPQTGKAVESTCHYDKNGDPIYTLHLSQQLDKLGANPYVSCTQGYEGTDKLDPDSPRLFPKPNLRAHCAAAPTDPKSPNVRGSQNITKPWYERPREVIHDPTTGLVTDGESSAIIVGVHGEAPPTGPAGLAWLLMQPLADLGEGM